MIFFKNRYRIESIRLKNWHYHSTAYYFITICTRNRECFFGNVIETEVKLSSIGKQNRLGPQSRNLASIIRGNRIGVKGGVDG